MYSARDIDEVLLTIWRVLIFRPVKPDLKRLGPLYLGIGLLLTWFAGIGRYWDNPRAETWQMWGLGSLAYVFVMALFLWALLAPLRPRNWHYGTVLVFVTMTSPPALLYLIPVEKFMSMKDAQSANTMLLAVVASWRMILLWLFLQRSAGFGGGRLFVATFLPVIVVIVALAALNLEHVTEVFASMGGFDPEARTVNDTAYNVLTLIALLCVFISPIFIISYLVMVIRLLLERDGARK